MVLFSVFLIGLFGPALAWNHTHGDDRKPKRVSLDGIVMATKLKHRVEPMYPAEARKKRVEGTVKLRVLVSTEGAVIQMQVDEGPPMLAAPAMDAVRQWRYDPVVLDGEAVEVVTSVDVTFKLK